MQTLADKIVSRDSLLVKLREHAEASAKAERAIRAELALAEESIGIESAGLDEARVILAEHVIYAMDPTMGGSDWKTCVADAVHEIAHGKARCYQTLNDGFLGTKNYDRWSGQRSDHPYGYGPRHGSICFEIGLTQEARKRGGVSSLNEDEKDAAIYYLMNLSAVWNAKRNAKELHS